MSNKGAWFSRINSDDQYLNTDALLWKNSSKEFLMNYDHLKEDDYSNYDLEQLQFAESKKRGHISIAGLPKEQTLDEARRFLRKEKFEHLAIAKEGRVIDREIRLMKDSLSNTRLIRQQELADAEEAAIAREKRKIKPLHIIRSNYSMTSNNSLLPKNSDLSGQQSKLEITIAANTFEISCCKKLINDRTDYPLNLNTQENALPALSNKVSDSIESEGSDCNDARSTKSSSTGRIPLTNRKPTSPKEEKVGLDTFGKVDFLEQKALFRSKGYYWARWRQYINTKKKRVIEEKELQDKIDRFIKKLNDYSKEQNENKETADKKYRRKTAPSSRDKKMEFSEKEDGDLKEISEAIENSTANTRLLLRSKSVQRLEPTLRGKAKLIRIITTAMNNNMEERTNLVQYPSPTILQEMDKKHVERKQRVQDILEKKRLLEEEKDRIVKEKYQQQLLEAALEKKRKLEAFKEKMRLERIAREKQKEEWIRIQTLTRRAVELHRYNLLMKYGFQPWKLLVQKRRTQNSLAKLQDSRRIRRNYISMWKNRINEIHLAKQQKADDLWGKIVKRTLFERWRTACFETKLLYQVAEDWHDQWLLCESFYCWQDFVAYERYEWKMKWNKAVTHYKRKELTRYLKQWMLLPQANVLEKEKERRKQQLREKVQQVLPDYRPSSLFDSYI